MSYDEAIQSLIDKGVISAEFAYQPVVGLPWLQNLIQQEMSGGGTTMETYYDEDMGGWVTLDENGNQVDFQLDPSSAYQGQETYGLDTGSGQLEQVQVPDMPSSIFIPGVSDPAGILYQLYPDYTADAQATLDKAIADANLASSAEPDLGIQDFIDAQDKQLLADIAAHPEQYTVSAGKAGILDSVMKAASGAGSSIGGGGGSSKPSTGTTATTTKTTGSEPSGLSAESIIPGVTNGMLLLLGVGAVALLSMKGK